MPSQRNASRIARTLSRLERSWSVSSTRMAKTPPSRFAQSPLKSRVRAPPLAMLGLGFVLGLRHATDVDHVAAVTATASRERTLRGALGLGALWGIGHTATGLVVGGAIVAFGLVIPPKLGECFELGVAAMLVTLGLMNFSRARH